MSDAMLITDLSQVTPPWLTATLRRAGALGDGEVVAVTAGSPRTTSFSTIVHLHLRYDGPTAGPAGLVLKYSLPTRPVQVAEQGWEVRFYTRLAPALAGGPLLRCYDAVFAPEQGRIHLLLEDLSATHEAGEASHLPPTEPRCRQIVDALAQVHARWWGRPPLEIAGQALLSDATIAERTAALAARAAAFQEMLGDRLSPERRQIYAEVLDALPRLFARLRSPFAMSVVHDDIHIGNFLYPRDPARDTLRIIDWQTWTTDLAVKDLAHMLAYFWFPERRAPRAAAAALLPRAPPGPRSDRLHLGAAV